jgi:Glycosyl hydrolases family 15
VDVRDGNVNVRFNAVEPHGAVFVSTSPCGDLANGCPRAVRCGVMRSPRLACLADLAPRPAPISSAEPRPPRARRRRPLALASALAALALLGGGAAARAEGPIQRTFFQLASSNGHGAVLLDLKQARLTHFREHLYASEQPLYDAAGNEVWAGNQPRSVISRDLLYDAYFGLRQGGGQRWLTAVPVDLNVSGYAPFAPGKTAGTGVVTMVQKDASLEATQYFFAPRALGHDGFVMAMRVRNTGSASVSGVSAFTLHNFHLGFGRPASITDLKSTDTAENGETMIFDASGKGDFIERGFAGAVVARPLGAMSHHGATYPGSPGNVFTIVNSGGSQDLPDLSGQAPTGTGSVSAYQFDLGALNPGEERWAGVAFVHHGDPFADKTAQGWLDAYVGTKDAKQLVDQEIASWTALQDGLNVPAGLAADEVTLLRQSAVMLAMAQVEENSTFLREWLTMDGEPRYSAPGQPKLPATVGHKGKGAVLASLPPGEWTVAWIRDGSYAATAMVALGMKAAAREALAYYLGATAGLFQTWNELKPYSVPPYQISLCRYHGFGVEETDFNEFGPNLEFDGLGLFLWALRHYDELSGDPTLVEDNWATVSGKVADVLVALVNLSTGLLRPDSSIWETHWNGRQRTYTYTNITAARGLCDAAAMAARHGDATAAKRYKDAGLSLAKAIAQHLTDAAGGLASNAEELASGSGYWDAAVIDGIAMGLFDPKGAIAAATMAGLDKNLAAPAGAGWSRNDDNKDHLGSEDKSPWGSDYDSAEWVVTDLRGAVATRRMGDTTRSDRLLAWVTNQSLANYLAIAETYNELTAQYKFNAPMVGFGAGAYVLALADREKPLDGPACGEYADGGFAPGSSATSAGSGGNGTGANTGAGNGTGSGSGPSSGAGTALVTSGGNGSGGAGEGGSSGGGMANGCSCRAAGFDGDASGAGSAGALLLAAVAFTRGRRLRTRP